MSKPRFFTVAAMVFAAALTRLVPHPWNFTPLAAMALFAGAHFADRRLALAVPLIALLISDVFLGFYSTMAWIYASFMISVLIGRLVRRNREILPIFGAAFASSIQFFVVTNFGHWLASDYPRTPAGLAACYGAAIPFFRNTLMGDLFFTAVLFGLFGAASMAFPSLREKPSLTPLTAGTGA